MHMAAKVSALEQIWFSTVRREKKLLQSAKQVNNLLRNARIANSRTQMYHAMSLLMSLFVRLNIIAKVCDVVTGQIHCKLKAQILWGKLIFIALL
eukprot:m.1231095 g.1231095  ORF g.1231095 m.1231095 type:complete len:95 (+) comp24657_c0_seq15:328-612(+)